MKNLIIRATDLLIIESLRLLKRCFRLIGIPKIIYLAGPYTHDLYDVRVHRYFMLSEISAYLMEVGYIVFSPISHSHIISTYLDNSCDGSFWLLQDLPFLLISDMVVVAKMDGWQKSDGIKKEKKIANKFEIPVHYINPFTFLEQGRKKYKRRKNNGKI